MTHRPSSWSFRYKITAVVVVVVVIIWLSLLSFCCYCFSTCLCRDTHTAHTQLTGGGGHRVRALWAGGDSPRTDRVDTHTHTDRRARARAHTNTLAHTYTHTFEPLYVALAHRRDVSRIPSLESPHSLVCECVDRTIAPGEKFETQFAFSVYVDSLKYFFKFFSRSAAVNSSVARISRIDLCA
jgi:hypothetical protein